MTPNIKTKMKDGAFSRIMPLLNIRTVVEGEESYIVEGYAARYEPYELYRYSDSEIVMEQFTRQNFEDADKTDIIFQFDHEGRVYARVTNGTLNIIIDDIGLKVIINLSKTESARQIYEEIKAGMITKMSWRFFALPEDVIVSTIRSGDNYTYMITYKTIRRIYDVSAVSLPANENTEISARSAVDGLIAAEKARRDADEALNKRVKALLEWAERTI